MKFRLGFLHTAGRGPWVQIGRWHFELKYRYRWNKGKRKFFQYAKYPGCYEEPWDEWTYSIGPIQLWWTRS